MPAINIETSSFQNRRRDRPFVTKPAIISKAAMIGLALTGAAMLTPATAEAQSPQLENTCQIAARNFLLTDHLNVGIVQSFPELKPPGVRLTYSIRPGTAKSDMSDSFECEFDKTDPPYHLTRFCVSDVCYSANDTNADRKRRFDEMSILLDRTNK